MIDVPGVKTMEQIIEIPRVEYQEVAGNTTYVSVDLGTVRQMAPSVTEQVREVGPDLEARTQKFEADVADATRSGQGHRWPAQGTRPTTEQLESVHP